MAKKYTPNYPDPSVEPDKPNVSGMSPRANVEIEEAAQRRVAEDPNWLLARELSPNRENSRNELEGQGFEVLAEEGELFSLVRPPAGWTKKTEGYWTYVYDETNKERLMQFYKGAWYDTSAFISVSK